MKFRTHNNGVEFEGSHLIGYVHTTYRKLVKAFGEPFEGDGYKVDAEWRVKFEDDTYCTIYNYKDGKSYCGDEGLPVSQITDWHVGGNEEKCTQYIQDVLDKLDKKKEEQKLKRFRVFAILTETTYIDVEAENENAAMDIARQTDGGDFLSEDNGDWEVTHAEEIGYGE